MNPKDRQVVKISREGFKSNMYEMLEKKCPYCLIKKTTRKGCNRKHTKRRYYYSFDTRYVECGKDYFIDEETMALIDRLLLERLSLRGVCRAVRISLT